MNACFLWTFKHRRKRQVNKATKQIELIEIQVMVTFLAVTIGNIHL